MKARLSFFCVGLIILVTVPIVAFADADGFRGINWGTNISTLTDMQLVGTDPTYGGIKKYSRKNDELKIGAATLESIEYGFWQGKFSCVMIRIKKYTNFLSLKDATFEKFGTGFKPNQFMEEYAWFGDKTAMLLDYSGVSRTGSLFLFSLAHLSQFGA